MLEKNPKTRDDRQVLLACRFLFLKGSIQLKTPPRQSVEVRSGCPVHAGGYLQSASCRGRGYLGVLRSRHSCAFHRGAGGKGWLVGQRPLDPQRVREISFKGVQLTKKFSLVVSTSLKSATLPCKGSRLRCQSLSCLRRCH